MASVGRKDADEHLARLAEVLLLGDDLLAAVAALRVGDGAVALSRLLGEHVLVEVDAEARPARLDAEDLERGVADREGACAARAAGRASTPKPQIWNPSSSAVRSMTIDPPRSAAWSSIGGSGASAARAAAFGPSDEGREGGVRLDDGRRRRSRSGRATRRSASTRSRSSTHQMPVARTTNRKSPRFLPAGVEKEGVAALVLLAALHVLGALAVQEPDGVRAR